MKKILFLLLLSVTMYGQVPADATPLENIQITNNVEDNVSTKVTVQNPNGVQNWKYATSLPVSTATANALDLKVENSAGAIQGFAITNNGNGTVNIAAGTAYLRTTNDPFSPLIKYVIPAVTNLALTDNMNNFVLVDYNGGSPALTVTVSPGTINTTTNSLAYVISRVGTTLDYISLVGQNVDANGKLRRRFLNSEGLRRASGAVLSASNRNLIVTAGLYYSGLIEVPTPAFNTSTGSTFTQAYTNGAWARSTGNTQINNTQYSLAGVLTTMPSNDYRVDYVYILADNPSKLYVLLGTTTYNNITNARLAPVPVDLPSELQVLGTRIGRVIIQKDATTTETSSEYASIYQAGSVQLHNDLGGLNLGEFQHLTVAEKANNELKTNKQNSLTVDGTGIKYPTVDAVNTGLALKANDADVVHKTGVEVKTGALTINGTTAPISLVGNSVNNIGVSASSDNGLPLSVSTTTGSKIASFISAGNEKSSINNLGGYVINGVTAANALLAGGGNLANPISGTGTVNTFAKWATSNTQNSSALSEGASLISSTKSMDISGTVDILTLRKPSSNMPGILLIGATSNTIFEGGDDFAIYTNGILRSKITKAGVYNLTGLAGSGTRTVVADASGNLSAVAVGYKVYTALLTQTGTGAPVATVLDNTLGGTVVWTRTSTGIYVGTLSGAFTSNKTSVSITNGSAGAKIIGGYADSVNTISIGTVNSTTSTVEDGVLFKATIEIRVYN